MIVVILPSVVFNQVKFSNLSSEMCLAASVENGEHCKIQQDYGRKVSAFTFPCLFCSTSPPLNTHYTHTPARVIQFLSIGVPDKNNAYVCRAW